MKKGRTLAVQTGLQDNNARKENQPDPPPPAPALGVANSSPPLLVPSAPSRSAAAWCRRRPPGPPLLGPGGALPVFSVLCFRPAGCPETAMSRGHRPGGDVMGLMPEEDTWNPPYPWNFSLPPGSPRGTGRVGILNDRLLRLYDEIGRLGNHIDGNRRQVDKCTPNWKGDGWTSALDMHQGIVQRAQTERELVCKLAVTLIVEIEALGHKAYIPPLLRAIVRKPQLLPFGCMSYLCHSPHYYSPEEYSIPHGLPVGDSSIKYISCIHTIGDANCFLCKKYGVLVRHLNRARFFRDWRVRQGASAGSGIAHNPLTSEIVSCRNLFEQVLGLIKKWQGSHAAKLFTMPEALHNLIVSDNAVMDLFPSGEGVKELYLFSDFASGYALFRVYDRDAALGSFHDWERLKTCVRLIVYYPFASPADALQQSNAISEGLMTKELKSLLALYLPDPEGWKQVRLGVPEKKLGKLIRRETGIHCRSKDFIQELLSGVRLNFDNFIGVEEVPAKPSNSDDSVSDDSDEEPPQKKQKGTAPSVPAKATAAKEKTSSDDESNEDSEEDEEDEEPAKNSKKEAPVLIFGKQTATKEPKTPMNTQSQATGSNTLFMANIPFRAELEDVKEFFEATGEVVDVRFPADEAGSRKGFCFVQFVSAEAAKKALEEMCGKEMHGRAVTLEFAHERNAYTPRSGNTVGSFQKPARGNTNSVLVGGFNKSLEEDKIRSSLEQHFGGCGEITRVSIPLDYETGAVKGIAYLDFNNQDSVSKALELRGSTIDGYQLYAAEAKPKGDGQRGGGRSGGRSGDWFGGRRGGSGRFGDRSGGRDGGRFG